MTGKAPISVVWRDSHSRVSREHHRQLQTSSWLHLLVAAAAHVSSLESSLNHLTHGAIFSSLPILSHPISSQHPLHNLELRQSSSTIRSPAFSRRNYTRILLLPAAQSLARLWTTQHLGSDPQLDSRLESQFDLSDAQVLHLAHRPQPGTVSDRLQCRSRRLRHQFCRYTIGHAIRRTCLVKQ